MNQIFKKCHCGEDAILIDMGPDFKKGKFKRVFRCKNGHEFSEETGLDWLKEINQYIESLK
jgi:hypothetical protein